MAEDFLVVERTPPIATIRLNRAQQRNALSLELMRALIAQLQELSEDEETGVVVLTGDGPAFSSGHDLKEMLDRDLSDYREIFDVCTDLMTTIQKIRQPVIAQVDGVATAAGCQLVASCDLAIASEESKFATPGVRIGLFCSTPMVALTRAIGRKRALEMLLTGKPIDAATAADWGLINHAVPREKLSETVRELACQIAQASPLTVSVGKRAFYEQVDLEQPKAYAYAKEVMSMNALADDAQEGMTAFLEKRKACWTGR
jgi:enoyl-CoA hydratase/carnithine racemase